MDFLHHPYTDRIILGALAEDLGLDTPLAGDHTSLSTIPAGTQASARCLIKDTGILAGVAVAERVFQLLDASVKFYPRLSDGEVVNCGDIAFEVAGEARSILIAERTVLNIMQRMSGIATQTNQYAKLIAGTGCQLLDTRKTTPLVRHLEKWAVAIGGGTNHRYGLYDMILIKDNHVDVAGGIPQAIRAAQQYLRDKSLTLDIEVETRNLDEVRQAVETGGVRRIMLDNMSLDMMRQAVQLIGTAAETEASGGITAQTIRAVAETGVNFISSGALTHSARSLDISLKIAH